MGINIRTRRGRSTVDPRTSRDRWSGREQAVHRCSLDTGLSWRSDIPRTWRSRRVSVPRSPFRTGSVSSSCDVICPCLRVLYSSANLDLSSSCPGTVRWRLSLRRRQYGDAGDVWNVTIIVIPLISFSTEIHCIVCFGKLMTVFINL